MHELLCIMNCNCKSFSFGYRYFTVAVIFNMDSSPSRQNEVQQSDINQTLQLVLDQLKGQRQEISSLREDVKGNNFSVTSEVKKLKEKELSWKKEGNKIQYTFNSQVSDLVGQATWAIQNNKLDYALDLLKETDEKVHQRNKLIRIADTSEGGWETVRQYEANPVASDSEDENKISKAENRALRKRKRSLQKKSSTSQPKNALLPGPPSYGRNPPLQSWGMQNSASAGASTSNFRPYSGKIYGSCFACRDFSHYRKDCPYVSGTYTKQRYPTDNAQNRK
ncbi:uncharacterized protein LOC132727344 [Ruditapes philippinarum]|uniref:uncharacterized protein LOC132727344 n=1 Tax=Ruditapes philippinarum TaxID=129788 RepID=UPI00295A77C8|nr:uncharacterized protein LOC132727344 [Ruditapes philippinarum]